MQMQRESDNQELSFTSLDFEDDQKLRLIDISREDDNLLNDSPFIEDLRLSVTFDELGDCNLSEPQPSQRVKYTVENLLKKEQELSPSLALVPESPNHARKSLAWDSAFFTNAGVLNNDELSFINEGFKMAEMQPATCKNVLTQRFEPGYGTKDDAVSSASRKIDTSNRNRTYKSASERGSMKIQRSLQNTTQRLSKREEPHLLSLKAPKESSRMINLLAGKSRSASRDAYHAKENRTATMRSTNNLKLRKKSALENSCRLSTGSPPEVVASVFARSSKSSTVLSSSHGAAVRYLEKGQELGHPRCSTQSLSLLKNFCCMSPATSSIGSSSEPRSMAKQQSHEIEVYPDTSMTLRRTIGSHNEVIESPYLVNNLRIQSPAQKEEASSPDEPTYQCTPDPFHVPKESRKNLKPSYLRMPSPKIGFFDEEKSVMPTMRGSFQLQFETQCTPPNKNCPTNRQTPSKLPRAGTSSETKSLKFGSRKTQLQHPGREIKPGHIRSDGKLKSYSPKIWSTMKTTSDVDSRFQSGTCREVGEWICSKCRKIGAGERDRKRVGQICVSRPDDEKRVKGRLRTKLGREIEGQKYDSTIPRGLKTPVKKEQYKANNLHLGNEDETRMLANFEDQVSDLSRYFEVIDLTKDMVIENEDEKDYCDGTDNNVKAHDGSEISSFIGEHVADNQKQEMAKIFTNHIPSLSGTELSPSSRTPLVDKTSFSNKSGSLKQSAKGKLLAKSVIHACSDKENSYSYEA